MRVYSKLVIVFALLLILLLPIGYECYIKSNWLNAMQDYSKDSIAGFQRKAQIDYLISWDEHPNGQYRLKTNANGFRENTPTLVQKANHTKRILITGDSHIDGVINNEESFPNLLEQKLNIYSKDYNSYEIINASCGYYSFQQYLGILKKNLYLKPDQFVITIYTGNDFIETLIYENPPCSFLDAYKHVWYRINKNIQLNRVSAVKSQALNQLLYFKMYPQDTIKALTFSKHYLMKIDSICTKENIELIVLFLPTKPDVETSLFLSWKEKLKWSTNDVLLNRILAARLRDFLKANQIMAIDLLTQEYSDVKLFYDSDHHLNGNGHKAIARYLFDRCYLFE